MQAEGGGHTSCSFVRAASSAGRPGRRWAHWILCGPLPTPTSESEEHDSPHFPICCGRRLCRVGSARCQVGPQHKTIGRR